MKLAVHSLHRAAAATWAMPVPCDAVQRTCVRDARKGFSEEVEAGS